MSTGTVRAVDACVPGRAAISSAQAFPAGGLSEHSARMTRRDSRSRCPACPRPAFPREATSSPQPCIRRCPRSRRPASAARAAIGDARLQTVEAQARGRCEGPRDLRLTPRWCRGDRASAARARHPLHRAAPPAWVEWLPWRSTRLRDLLHCRVQNVDRQRPCEVANTHPAQSHDAHTNQEPKSPRWACHTWKYRLVQLEISHAPCAESLSHRSHRLAELSGVVSDARRVNRRIPKTCPFRRARTREMSIRGPTFWDQAMSKRSRFITLFHAATKSCTKAGCASLPA